VTDLGTGMSAVCTAIHSHLALPAVSTTIRTYYVSGTIIAHLCAIDDSRTRGLAGSRRTLLNMQQRAVGGRLGFHLKSVTSYQNSDSVY